LLALVEVNHKVLETMFWYIGLFVLGEHMGKVCVFWGKARIRDRSAEGGARCWPEVSYVQTM
jgi:hypothetical protein